MTRSKFGSVDRLRASQFSTINQYYVLPFSDIFNCFAKAELFISLKRLSQTVCSSCSELCIFGDVRFHAIRLVK